MNVLRDGSVTVELGVLILCAYHQIIHQLLCHLTNFLVLAEISDLLHRSLHVLLHLLVPLVVAVIQLNKRLQNRCQNLVPSGRRVLAERIVREDLVCYGR